MNPYSSFEILISQVEAELENNAADLREGRDIAEAAGLDSKSDLPTFLQQIKDGTAASALTGGHSNTDHEILLTGDYVTDRIAELRRNMVTRTREALPEFRGEDRWDKPRAPGERRRRITRERDLPAAPPEPPPSGYTIFLGQMTTKLRHDRRDERHDQTRIVQDISKIWRVGMKEEQQKYYHTMCEEVRREYKRQHLEFRATGYYTPSERFERTDGAGLWMHKLDEEKNALEREISSYDTVIFPLRPAKFDSEYREREIASKERRKLKLKREREAARLKKSKDDAKKSKKAKTAATDPEVTVQESQNSASDPQEELAANIDTEGTMEGLFDTGTNVSQDDPTQRAPV